FSRIAPAQPLLSFPTRRSSDLFAALVLGHRYLVRFGIFDQAGAAGEIPFAPRRNHADIGRERIITELEADLVIALAGRAKADRVDRKSTRLNSSHSQISYAVFC